MLCFLLRYSFISVTLTRTWWNHILYLCQIFISQQKSVSRIRVFLLLASLEFSSVYYVVWSSKPIYRYLWIIHHSLASLPYCWIFFNQSHRLNQASHRQLAESCTLWNLTKIMNILVQINYYSWETTKKVDSGGTDIVIMDGQKTITNKKWMPQLLC